MPDVPHDEPVPRVCGVTDIALAVGLILACPVSFMWVFVGIVVDKHSSRQDTVTHNY